MTCRCIPVRQLEIALPGVFRRHPQLRGARPVPIESARRQPSAGERAAAGRRPVATRGAPAQGLFGAVRGAVVVHVDMARLLDTLSPQELADLFYRLGLSDGARVDG